MIEDSIYITRRQERKDGTVQEYLSFLRREDSNQYFTAAPINAVYLQAAVQRKSELQDASADYSVIDDLLGYTEVQAVENIGLGEERIMADGSQAPPETPEEVIDRLINPEVNRAAVKKLEKGRKRHTTPQGAVEQLRQEGVDAKMMDQLHAMSPGFGSPEVQKHFQDRVTGLMSGSLTINDIRNEAIDVRDQLKELMDELGPGGEALGGYYGILDGFIQKTDPNAPLTVPGIAPLTPKPIPLQ